MQETNVELKRLTDDDRESFIKDNQWAFKHGAMIEFGERDDHVGLDGEIISRKTIENSIDAENAETYRIFCDGKKVGGIVLSIDKNTNRNHLELLFVLPEEHGKGIGYEAWKKVEALHPETEIWETCTPYFEKRNIHFYVNKCGFQIDQFWCEFFKPDHTSPFDDGADDCQIDYGDGPDEMFRFIKIMK